MDNEIKVYNEIEKLEIDNRILKLSDVDKAKFNSFFELQKKDITVGLAMVSFLGIFAGGTIYYGNKMPKITWILLIPGWITMWIFIGTFFLVASQIIQLVYLKRANDSFNYELKEQFLTAVSNGNDSSSNPNESSSIETTNSPWNYE